MLTKSGFMVAWARRRPSSFADARPAWHGCDIVTIGQYLRPSLDHLPIDRYYDPSEYEHSVTTAARSASATSRPAAVRSSYTPASHRERATVRDA